MKEINGVKYEFNAVPWKYDSPGGWCFLSLPLPISKEIRTLFKLEEQGWGRLKATAKIGYTVWETAIWFDTKSQTYLLPLKAEIRKKERIALGESIDTCIRI